VGFNDLLESLEYAGIGHTDFVAQVGYEITNLIYYIITIAIMFTYGDGLRRFAKASATLGRKCKTNEGLITHANNKLIINQNDRRLVTICLFQITGICFLSYFWYFVNTSVLAHYNLEKGYMNVLVIIVCILWVPLAALTLMPVPVLCLEAGISASLTYLAVAFGQWRMKFKCKNGVGIFKKLHTNQIGPGKKDIQESTPLIGN
jgi:hypothetical protein